MQDYNIDYFPGGAGVGTAGDSLRCSVVDVLLALDRPCLAAAGGTGVGMAGGAALLLEVRLDFTLSRLGFTSFISQ